jgi:hypothetical protein
MNIMRANPQQDTDRMAKCQSPLSMLEQAEMIDHLVGRCVMRGGVVADETLLVITGQTAGNLISLANHLRRLSHVQGRPDGMVKSR